MKQSCHPLSQKIILACLITMCACKQNAQVTALDSGSEVWITSGDRSSLLKKITTPFVFGNDSSVASIIALNANQRFQSIDGFGFALTGGSAYLIHQKLRPAQQDSLLKELFTTEANSVGISYLRISMGASDLDDHVFSYDDLPIGATDVGLTKFNLDADKKDLIPVLKKILAVSPNVKIMGSPWSPPAWMKSNNNTKAGKLKPEYYSAYAEYFVKYIKEMAGEGIKIDAVTIQNEPENPKNNPSLEMTAGEEANFIKNNLGPAFQKAGLSTKIVVFDHNCDHPQYPIAILDDVNAKKFINGSAFHLYGGEIEALSKVHDAHPDRDIYFTEQWTWSKGEFAADLRWHTKNLIIGATRNWSRNVLEWNLAADPENNPHTPGGCFECRGALTIGDSVSRNVSYYIIAQASKFVRPGSVRVASNLIDSLPNVAFLTPDNKKVLIVLNDSDQAKSFGIKFNGKFALTSLPKATVGTYVW